MKIENITVSDWRDYERHDFSFNSHDGLIVLPKTPAEGSPWVWRAEFFSAFDTVDMDLLSKGWAIAYYSVSDMYGAPGAIALMKPFKDALVEKYSLSAKCAMFGFSRGGLYTVNYTAEYPEDIAVIYLDAPVCDIRSWPGNFGKGGGDDFCWKECKEHYGITDESAKTFSGNPLDKIEKLVLSGKNKKCYSYVWMSVTFFWDKKLTEEKTKIEFEGHEFVVPKDYKKMLELNYKKWWELPPEDQRIGHGLETIIDLENNYTKYTEKQ